MKVTDRIKEMRASINAKGSACFQDEAVSEVLELEQLVKDARLLKSVRIMMNKTGISNDEKIEVIMLFLKNGED